VDLGVQFFTAAKSQHESGAKWSLIVLVLLLYFHLAIAGPYARQTADKAEVDRALEDNRKVEAQLDPIVKSAAAFVKRVDGELTEVSARLRDDLVAHFRSLDQAIQQLSILSPEEAEGDLGNQVFTAGGSGGFAQQQQQQQQQQAPPPDDLAAMMAPMPPALRGMVATAAQTGDATSQHREEIERYIAASIITPAFARANALWTSRDLPGLLDNARTLTAEIEKSAASAGNATDQLKQLQAAVASLSEEARRLSFVPPADEGWWRSVAGKEESIGAMVDAMQRGARKLGAEQGKLQAARDEVSRSVQANLERTKQIDEALAELEKQARDLQAQLGEIGEPLKVVAVRLSLLAPLLPLVIALAIAALTLWRAEALRRMRFAAGLVPSGDEGDVLRRWLQEAAGGSVGLMAVREIVIAGIAIAWVLSAWQGVRALPVPHLSSFEIVSLALTALIAARAYHCYQAGQALRIAGGR
jgi:methyl-accepting chemotaxis protein